MYPFTQSTNQLDAPGHYRANAIGIGLFKGHLEALLSDSNAEHPSPPPQGQLLFQRLLGLNSRGVKLKIASSLTNSAELKTLAAHSERLSHFHFMNAI